MPPTQTDPWLEADKDGFGQVSFTPDPDDMYLEDEPNIVIAPNDQLQPEVITNTHVPSAPEPVASQPEPVAVAPEPDGPEIVELPDNCYLEIEKSSKGWKATLDSTAVGGRKEVFYGKNKNEMINNVLVGKLEATKLINKLTRKIKLGEPDTPTVTETVQKVETATGRRLTADEIAEVKLLWESDADKALETWFTKRTGTTVDALVRQAQEGNTAAINLAMESAAKAFVTRNPDYYADGNYANYRMLLGYMTKNKLRKVLTEQNEQALAYELAAKNLYTVENLEEAYNELSEDGLLLKPATPRAIPPTPVTTAPATTERIVRQETRPRAGLGIRTSDVTPVPVQLPTPPSAEDMNDWTDEQIKEAYHRQLRAEQLARYPRRKQ